MSIPLIRLMIVASLLATVCLADWWDDFSNNLAADLAPLLSLFGEQATKQFLSESTSILDNIIFALAPLGVVTAVVSVIRVCGGPSLRAFVGRAQEGGGVVEAELCSSTSRDVCEMYHNGAIVRVFGRPRILEVIHDPEAIDFYDCSDARKAACGIYSFAEFLKTPVAKAAKWGEKEETSNRKHDTSSFGVNDMPAQGDMDSESMVAGIQTESTHEENKKKFAPNPNLSLNIGFRKASRGALWAFVVVGCIAQASVIVFAIYVTLYLRWEKEDARPEPWGLPMMISGTLLLSLGMFSCAYLIERSTMERNFTRRSKSSSDNVSIHVMQPGNQKIGDQTYDAFAYTNKIGEFVDYTTSWKRQDDEPTDDLRWRAKLGHTIKVWFATITTILGFVLQFVGLRALHSAISVVLLGAICFMSMIRAGLRTMRLEKEQNLLRHCPDQVAGYEMDWLALRLGLGPEGDQSGFWSVLSPSVQTQPVVTEEEISNTASSRGHARDRGCGSIMRRIAKEGGKTTVCAFRVDGTATDFRDAHLQRALKTAEARWLKGIESDKLSAQRSQPNLASKLYYYRSRLAKMTAQPTLGQSLLPAEWDQLPVRNQVQQLKKAIEASAEVLFSCGIFKPVDGQADLFTRRNKSSNDWKEVRSFAWSIDVVVPRQGIRGKRRKRIHVFLRQPSPTTGGTVPKWEIDEQSLEAVLGLWAWSLISSPMTQRKDAFGLIQSTAAEVPVSRILAIRKDKEDIRHLQEEFKYWTNGLGAFSTATKLVKGLKDVNLGAHSLWQSKCEDTLELKSESAKEFQRCDPRWMRRMFGWHSLDISGAMDTSHIPGHMHILMADVKHSLQTLCAQDVYQSFLSAMVSVLDSIGGKTTLVETSHGFYLSNEIVSKLLESFEMSGLGTREDAYLVIVPALRNRSTLPTPTVVLPQVYQKADEHRQKRRFKAAEKVLHWAYQVGLDAGYKNEAALDVEATILELAELYRFAHRAEMLHREIDPPEGFYSNGLSWLKEARESLALTPINEVIDRYLELDKTRFLTDYPGYGFNVALATAKDGHRMPCLWALTRAGESQYDNVHGPVTSTGDLERSILSWAAQRGWREVVKSCLEMHFVVDSQDEKGWTPLTYAAANGHIDVVRMLMQHGANPAKKDKAETPILSHAAENGFASVVEVLLEDESVDVGVKGFSGQTSLQCAAACGSCDTIDVLLRNEKDAQIDQCNASGDSALVIAWQEGQSEAARHLRKLGAKFDFKSEAKELWADLFWRGRLKSIVDSIQLLNEEKGKNDGICKVLLLLHASDHSPDDISTPGTTVREITSELEIVEITDHVTTNLTHDTIVRYLQEDIKTSIKIFGFSHQVLTIPPQAAHCFNFIMDFVSYLQLDLTKNVSILEAAAKSQLSESPDLFSYLLKQSGSTITITADIVKMVVGCGGYTAEFKLQHLIEFLGDALPTTEEVLEQATRSDDLHAPRMMELFLEKVPGIENHISSKVLLNLIVNRRPASRTVIEEVCSRGLKENVVSDVVLKEMLSTFDSKSSQYDADAFKMLLRCRQGEVNIDIFGDIAAKDTEWGKKSLALVLAHNDGETSDEQYDSSTT